MTDDRIRELACEAIVVAEISARSVGDVEEIIRQAVREAEIKAFVSGAAWWEYKIRNATMWGEDRRLAEEVATERYTPPVSPEAPRYAPDPVPDQSAGTEGRQIKGSYLAEQ